MATKQELLMELENLKAENGRLIELTNEQDVEIGKLKETNYQNISDSEDYKLLMKRLADAEQLAKTYKQMFEHETNENKELRNLLETSRTKRAGRKPNPAEQERKIWQLGELVEKGKKQAEIMEIMGIKQATYFRYLKQYRELSK